LFVWCYLSGKLEEAVEHLTKAILLNPTSAIMYGTRGIIRRPLAHSLLVLLHLLSAIIDDLLAAMWLAALMNLCSNAASVFIKMKKPAAAIRDATAALEVMTMFQFFNPCFPLMRPQGPEAEYFEYKWMAKNAPLIDFISKPSFILPVLLLANSVRLIHC
jgi:hypothetical protein